MNKIFGLDLGTNSIGWALRNPDLTENQIEKFGVLTFPTGVGKDDYGRYTKSYAAERTKKRSTRRLYQSRKYRLWVTLEILITNGYCPLSIENLNKWRHYSKNEAVKNNNGGRVYPVDDTAFDQWIKLDFNGDNKPDYTSPYQLRKELADTKLDFGKEENKMKLGRALYHIAQRRGFKSSRKSADDVKETEINTDTETELQYSERKKTDKLKAIFPDFDPSKPVGVFLAEKENQGIRLRLDITQYLVRENYKDEIKYIFEFQGLGLEHPLFINLVESGRNKNNGWIFYKRPLRSQKGLIGKCTLEPSKYRAPISHPSFELFRAWSFINNIKYKDAANETDYWKPLPIELKQAILHDKFFRKSRAYFPFSEIAELIAKKGHKWKLNYTLKTTVTACPVSARLKDIFGDEYQNIRIAKAPSEKAGKDYYDLDDIWHVLFSYEDQEFVTEFAEQKLKLSPENIKQFVIAWNALPVGYGMLSINAINKINKFLQKGLIYTEAVMLANLPEVIGQELWNKDETFFVEHISGIIDENRRQKTILNIVNNLVSQHKNLEQKFGYKDNSYLLDEDDKKDMQTAIEDAFGVTKWKEKELEEQEEIKAALTDCYQAYFKSTGFERKDINGERYATVKAGNHIYYKADSGYYRLPKLIDTLKEFLLLHFELTNKQLEKVYHPSEINIYPPAKPDENGNTKLGSPKTGSFKNPMAMRTLHELRKLLNYMIETQQIDSDTRIVVEVARELNDANKRWAIEAWQRRREEENKEYASIINQLLGEGHDTEDNKDKVKIWIDQTNSDWINTDKDAKKLTDDSPKAHDWFKIRKASIYKLIQEKEWAIKYRLWLEQECHCIYTGKPINITDLFDENVTDFEHTIPRSISFDNSLHNLTVCFHDYNRTIKKNKIPTQLNNYKDDYGGYSAILPRLKSWEDKIERIKLQIDFWLTKSKKASTKDFKDTAIRQRLLWQMELDYWQKKLERFTITEVTSGFKNSQKVDTQLISKYAFHYLKTYFEKVDVQKGSITAEFRKIYKLQIPDEKKDRSKHSHHAKDAAVLTLIPVAAKRDEILKTYYEYREQRNENFTTESYKGFKREFVWRIDDSVLINNITNNQSLTPAKRKVRKRGKEQYISGTSKPMWATGDCIRGQLHQETFYGAIKPAKRNEKGIIIKDEDGKMVLEDKLRYVIRVPFQFKKDANTSGFKTLEDILKQVVDAGLKQQIEKQVKNAGGLKEAFEKGMHLLDKNGNPHGNKIRHIRVWASVSEPLKIKKQTNLSKAEYKQHYYAGNATNSYFAIYKGNGKKDFDFKNLLETAQSLGIASIQKPSDLFEPSVTMIKAKKETQLPLIYILETGMKVIFKKEPEEVTQDLPKGELLKRLYVYTNFEKDGRLNFKYHLEARINNDIKETYSESEVDFNNPKPSLRFGYAKYDFLVQGYDYTIEMDGTIKWK